MAVCNILLFYVINAPLAISPEFSCIGIIITILVWGALESYAYYYGINWKLPEGRKSKLKSIPGKYRTGFITIIFYLFFPLFSPNEINPPDAEKISRSSILDYSQLGTVIQDTSLFNILVLKFHKLCEDNRDYGFVINERLNKLKTRDSLNISSYYFNNDIDPNFNNDSARVLQTQYPFDLIIFGNYQGSDCYDDQQDKVCYNWYSKPSFTSPNYLSENEGRVTSPSTLESVSKGNLQEGTDYIVYHTTGLANFNQSKFSVARKYWSHIIDSLNIDNSEIVSGLIACGLRLGDFSTTEEYSLQLLSISDNSKDSLVAYIFLINNLLIKENFPQAEKKIFEARKIFPDNPDLRLIYSLFLRQTPDYRKARIELEQLINPKVDFLFPINLFEARMSYAELLVSTNEFENDLKLAETILIQQKSIDNMPSHLMKHLLQKKQYVLALLKSKSDKETSLQEAKVLLKSNIIINENIYIHQLRDYRLLGIIYIEEDSLKLAKTNLFKSLELCEKHLSDNPSNYNFAEIYFHLGEVYFRELDFNNSIKYLKKCLIIEEESLGAYYEKTVQTKCALSSALLKTNSPKNKNEAISILNNILINFKANSDYGLELIQDVKMLLGQSNKHK